MLTQANALEGVSFGLASLSGAALAGVAIAFAGPVAVVAFDALTYFGFGLALLTVRFGSEDLGSGEVSDKGRRPGFGPVVRDAIRHPWLRDLLV